MSSRQSLAAVLLLAAIGLVPGLSHGEQSAQAAGCAARHAAMHGGQGPDGMACDAASCTYAAAGASCPKSACVGCGCAAQAELPADSERTGSPEPEPEAPEATP